jgi:hypothetical protein
METSPLPGIDYLLFYVPLKNISLKEENLFSALRAF